MSKGVSNLSDDQWNELIGEVQSGTLTVKEASIKYGIDKGNLYRRLNHLGIIIPRLNIPNKHTQSVSRAIIIEKVDALIEQRAEVAVQATVDYRVSFANYLEKVMKAKQLGIERMVELMPTEKNLGLVAKAVETMSKETLPILQALVDELTRKDTKDSDLEQLTKALIKKGYGTKTNPDPVPGDEPGIGQ